jgi:hypothetical protein
MIGFIDPFFYNHSYSKSIIALTLVYPLHKSLGHAIRFLATDLSQELLLQISTNSSCHFSFNHLGMPTLQNSNQFSNVNSPISLVLSNWLPCIYAAQTYRKHVSRVRIRGADHVENIAFSIVTKVYLPHRCLKIEVVVVADMPLPSRCLAMDIHVTILTFTE